MKVAAARARLKAPRQVCEERRPPPIHSLRELQERKGPDFTEKIEPSLGFATLPARTQCHHL